MDDCSNIKASHPGVSRTVIEETQISSISWQRVGQAKRRWQKLTVDAEHLRVGRRLEFSSGHPSTIHRVGETTDVGPAEVRRIQDIDKFVVQTFENRASKIAARIDDEIDRSRLAGN